MRNASYLAVGSVVGVYLAAGAIGCFVYASGEGSDPAPKVAELVIEESASETAMSFNVDAPSQVWFTMQAPAEKIRGALGPGMTTGELQIDPRDVAKTTGLIRVDIDALVLYQARSDSADGKYGVENKSETQNAHARAWLEIDETAPEAERDKNRHAEFSLQEVGDLSAADVTRMSGDRRRVTFTAAGEFRLHQRVSDQRVSMEAVFEYDGEELQSVEVRTLSPFEVRLSDHDVRPRTAFGTLASKTLAALSDKVAQVAAVGVELRATPVRPNRV